MKHTGEKPHECDKCDKTYRQKGDLKRHQDRDHERKTFKCDNCEKTFARKANLKDHQEKQHPQEQI